MKANECPGCGGPLDKTTDTKHVSWHVEFDECNRCMTVAYTQAKKRGASEKDALREAEDRGRLWRATAVENEVPRQ